MSLARLQEVFNLQLHATRVRPYDYSQPRIMRHTRVTGMLYRKEHLLMRTSNRQTTTQLLPDPGQRTEEAHTPH